MCVGTSMCHEWLMDAVYETYRLKMCKMYYYNLISHGYVEV